MSEVIDLALARRRLAIERAGGMAPADCVSARPAA
jgi:hypothetical protein